MVGLFNRLKWALAWDRALQLACRKQHREALNIIEGLPEDVRAKLLWCILRLQQNREIGNYVSAVDDARILIQRLQANETLAPSARAYLLAYVRWMGGSSMARLSESLTDSTLEEFGFDWSRIELAKVPEHLKRTFPLRPHRDWRD